MRLAQISDLHVLPAPGKRLARVDSAVSLAAVLEAVARSDPDGLLITGDLVNHGDAPSYRRVLSMIRELGIPMYALPGNHDDPAVLRQELAAECSLELVNRIGNWTILLVDSSIPGAAHGRVAGLRELEAALASGDSPVLVALHHSVIAPCPFPGCQLSGTHELLDVLAGSERVRAVVAGHTHTANESTWGAIRLMDAPSTMYEALHPVAGECRSMDDFLASHRINPERVGFRLHELGDDGSFESEVHWMANPGFAPRI